ncbi:snRNA-activating protein complex subunit 4 [Nematolebias whitei]|uniref:snRNA-activating protein complex subunit 4 n=1 Tax=Nematolebias whitei TaxID=451745 RepID=UPI00189703AB|nr:snRNA-activating protein complex subunit 4 [Nematolebias whitei]
MSESLSAERDRIQRQVDELEQSLSVTQNELDMLSSETDDGSDSEDELGQVQCPADLLAQKEKIQTAIQNLEDMLGPHSPISVSSEDSSSAESDLGLSESVDSCLQLNLVYQQVVQETLDHLETLLVHNQTQQRDITSQLYGPDKDRTTSSLQHPTKMFLGSFLKPYFRDKLTGLTGRTAFMCLQMFQRFVSDTLKRSVWTPEEDAQLRELIDKMRIGNFIPYTQMSYFMEGRDPAQLIYRWTQVLDPSLKKGPWTKQEDRLLLQAVSRYGQRYWWKVRLEVPGRTDSSCRDRYLDCLRKGVKRGPFDQQEIELLKMLVEKHGVGRWSKIAAEIPHRLDAQCMREWRKLSRLPKRREKRKKPRRRRGEGGEKKEVKAAASIQRRVGRQTVNIKMKEEEEMTEEEEEEEDVIVQYMDSDEDAKEEKKKVVQTGEAEEEEEYVIPPMKEWIPAEKNQTDSFLKFRLAALPSSADPQDEKPVRSTIVRKSGNSVIFGPPPRELRWEERHSSAAMMMVSRDQLRAHLSLMEQESKRANPRPRRGALTRVMNRGLDYELQAAITPWIGNLLFAKNKRKTMADILREQAETNEVSFSSVFLLLLHAMNVDINGCKNMIEKKKVVQAPPPTTSTNMAMDPRRITKLCQQKPSKQEEDEQRELMLQQLQEAQREKCRQPPRSQPRLLHQLLPKVTLRLPPNRIPQVFPRCVLLPSPVTQPTVASIQFAPPAPPFSVSMLPNSSPTVIPLALPTSSVSIGSTVTSNHAVLTTSITSSSTLSPSTRREEEITCRGQSRKEVPGVGLSETDGTQEMSSQTVRYSSSSSLQSTAPPPPPPQSCSPSSAKGLSLAPPTSTVLSEPPFFFTALPLRDHDYIAHNAGPTLKHPDPTPQKNLKCKSGGRKRKKEKEEQQEVGAACAVATQDGKRLRKPSLKAREAKAVQTEAKKKRSSASHPQQKRARRSGSKEAVISQTRPLAQAASLCLPPSQTMWVMTPSGLVPVVPPPHAQLAILPSVPCPAPLAPPPLTAESLRFVDLKPVVSVNSQNPASTTCQSKPLPSAKVLSHDPNHSPSHQTPAKLILPYKGVIKVDSPKAPPLRREELHFKPALISLEPPEAVRDWLSGRGGVSVPGTKSALPYLPPFVSTLSTLSALLRTKKTLTKLSLQLLSGASEPQSSQTDPGSAHSPSDLPDSTSDRRPAENQPSSPPDPPASSDQQEEEEEQQVKAVRQLVAERFSSNPAYQLLKARFLSCFTVPALLSTMQPITKKKLSHNANQEEEEDREEEEQLKKIEERGRKRITERSLLQLDGSAASANHFSGMISRPAADPQRVPQNQTMETRSEPSCGNWTGSSDC